MWRVSMQITGRPASARPLNAVHEAVRDLVRVRSAASEDLRKKRQMLLSFLLRHGRVFAGRKNWTRAHARGLAAQNFDHPA